MQTHPQTDPEPQQPSQFDHIELQIKNNNPHEQIKNSHLRWLMLLMVCNSTMCIHYCDDYPGVIEPQLKEIFNIDATTWSLLYSFTFYPNCIMPLLGGIFVDRVGIRRGLVIFCSMVLLGQVVFWAGAWLQAFWLMLVGRFLFGLCWMSFKAA